jgi:hypothetical protein
MDCNSGGKAIHSYVVALCVTILSVSLSHIINFSAKKNFLQMYDSKGAVAGLKRKEMVQGKISAHIGSSKRLPSEFRYTDVPATPFSNFNKQSLSKPTFQEISMITPASSHDENLREYGRDKEQLPDDVESKAKDENENQDMAGEATTTSASCLTAIEVFGKELILALIYEDLRDKEMRRQNSQHPWSHYGKINPQAQGSSTYFMLLNKTHFFILHSTNWSSEKSHAKPKYDSARPASAPGGA